MKIRVKESDLYPTPSPIGDVYIPSGTEFEVHYITETLSGEPLFEVKYHSETVFFFKDDIEILDDPLYRMREVKQEHIDLENEAREQVESDTHPDKHDLVLYTVSKRDGTVTGTYRGVVEDITIITYRHIKYYIRNSLTNVIDEVVVGHPQGWYSGDEVTKELTTAKKLGPVKQYEYYVVHDVRNDEILIESAYKHISDTEDYIEGMMGSPNIPEYYQIRKARIQLL